MTPALLLLAAATATTPAQPVLTLQQAQENTHINLPSLHLAEAQTQAQQASRDVVAAGYLPQISASASYYPLYLTTGGAALASGASVKTTNLSSVTLSQRAGFGVTINQLIYDFNQTIDHIKSQDQLVAAQRWNESAVWNNALVTTRTAYFNCQQDKELVTVAQENLNDLQKHVEQMAAFVQAGTHPPIDLAQAKQQASAAEYQLIQAIGNYNTAKAALQQAMGIDGVPGFDVSTDEFAAVQGEDQSTDALLPEALQARPDVVYLTEEIKAQRLVISSTRNGWTPSIEANGSAGGAWLAPYGGNSPVTPDVSVGLSLNWPLFLGGATQAQTRQTEAVLTELQAQLDAAKQQVRFDIDSARVAVQTAKGEVGSAKESLAYAKQELELANGQYAAGVGIALQVFDAEVAVFTAGGQLAQSVNALATGRAQLLRALGREKY